VQSAGELDKILAMIEREAVTVGKAPPAVVKGVTRPLAAAIRPAIPVEIRPVEIYSVIVRGALEGRSGPSVAAELRRSFRP